MARFRGLPWLALGLVACVAAPKPERNGGRLCRLDSECNPGPLCGLVRPCLDGFCAEDPVFRVCDAGTYPDGSTVAGQCITYLNCNATACGSLVPCVNNRCDTTVPPLSIPCDAGLPDARVDTGRVDTGRVDTGFDTGFDTGRPDTLPPVDTDPAPDTRPTEDTTPAPDSRPVDVTSDAVGDGASGGDAGAADASGDGAATPSDALSDGG
ncbi:MAG: hypothetical protein HY909_09375 [Deltaproteobacteria bacterium]|nr:hypothetical protein [Deltaproteobacteria bacterium]